MQGVENINSRKVVATEQIVAIQSRKVNANMESIFWMSWINKFKKWPDGVVTKSIMESFKVCDKRDLWKYFAAWIPPKETVRVESVIKITKIKN